MGAAAVVILPPRLDDRARFRQAAKHVLVQAFVAQLAVEALDEGVLHRLAGLDVVPAATSFSWSRILSLGISRAANRLN